MLLITLRKDKEYIQISDNIKIYVVHPNKKVKIGIDAPRDVLVTRKEQSNDKD